MFSIAQDLIGSYHVFEDGIGFDVDDVQVVAIRARPGHASIIRLFVVFGGCLFTFEWKAL